MPRCSTSTARCSRSGASAPKSAAWQAWSISSRRMPRSCPSRMQSFDAYTIAFGIRNVPHIDVALKEAFRVLKHGGRFLCLEFSEVDMPLLDQRLRALVLQRHSAYRPHGHRRCRALPVPRRIDPQVPPPVRIRRDDAARPVSSASPGATIRAASRRFIPAGNYEKPRRTDEHCRRLSEAGARRLDHDARRRRSPPFRRRSSKGLPALRAPAGRPPRAASLARSRARRAHVARRRSSSARPISSSASSSPRARTSSARKSRSISRAFRTGSTSSRRRQAARCDRRLARPSA